jgi:hypothetical protein
LAFGLHVILLGQPREDKAGEPDSYGSWTELGDKLPTGTVAAVLAELVVKRVRAGRDEHRDGAQAAFFLAAAFIII